MIKNLATLEVKVGEKVYKLLCEVDSTWGEVHDVLYQMKSFVVQKINEAHQADMASKEAQLPQTDDSLDECIPCKKG